MQAFQPLPVVPAPWMAHRCPTTGAVYYVNLQTLATTWRSPVPAPAPPPEDVPCATCMECPCACTARADDARAKALEAVKAHTAAPQKYSHHEDVPVDQSRRGHVKGVCVAYNRGYCRRGDDCRYEHAFTEEARVVAAATTFVDVREIPSSQIGRQPKKQPCFDLKHKGYCTRGAACPFAHTGHEGLPATRRQRKAQRAAEAQEPAAPVESPPPPVRAVTAPAPARHRSAERPRSPVRRRADSDDDDVVPQRERAPLPERHARRFSDDDGRDRPRRDYSSRDRPSPRRDYSRERPSPRWGRSREWRRDRSPDRWRGRRSRSRSRSRGRLFYG
jgi:hypothetical protein